MKDQQPSSSQNSQPESKQTCPTAPMQTLSFIRLDSSNSIAFKRQSNDDVFITGVEVQNIIGPQQTQIPEQINQIDQYRQIAVVDAAKHFTETDAICVNLKQKKISHVNANSLTEMHFDELCACYDQVTQVGRSLCHTFVTQSKSNKLVVNLVDKSNTNNNCGFNFANFEPQLLSEFYNDVAADYERSFIGSFIQNLLAQTPPDSKVFLSISKFDNHVGYSLSQSEDAVKAVPEFVSVSSIQDIYHWFTQANLKSKLTPSPAAIKDDLILIQFKLETNLKLLNTISFLNLPQQKSNDQNVKMIKEVIVKQSTNTQQFYPFNKSILTRILYPQLKQQNILFISHYSKQALNSHQNHIFNQQTDFGFICKKRKFHGDHGVKALTKLFKTQLSAIHKETRQFRAGGCQYEQLLNFLIMQEEGSGHLRGIEQVKGFLFNAQYQKYLQNNTTIDQIEYEVAKQNMKGNLRYQVEPNTLDLGSGTQTFLDNAKKAIDKMIQSKTLESRPVSSDPKPRRPFSAINKNKTYELMRLRPSLCTYQKLQRVIIKSTVPELIEKDQPFRTVRKVVSPKFQIRDRILTGDRRSLRSQGLLRNLKIKDAVDPPKVTKFEPKIAPKSIFMPVMRSEARRKDLLRDSFMTVKAKSSGKLWESITDSK